MSTTSVGVGDAFGIAVIVLAPAGAPRTRAVPPSLSRIWAGWATYVRYPFAHGLIGHGRNVAEPAFVAARRLNPTPVPPADRSGPTRRRTPDPLAGRTQRTGPGATRAVAVPGRVDLHHACAARGVATTDVAIADGTACGGSRGARVRSRCGEPSVLNDGGRARCRSAGRASGGNARSAIYYRKFWRVSRVEERSLKIIMRPPMRPMRLRSAGTRRPACGAGGPARAAARPRPTAGHARRDRRAGCLSPSRRRGPHGRQRCPDVRRGRAVASTRQWLPAQRRPGLLPGTDGPLT
jgi:hypothetical protein